MFSIAVVESTNPTFVQPAQSSDVIGSFLHGPSALRPAQRTVPGDSYAFYNLKVRNKIFRLHYFMHTFLDLGFGFSLLR